MDNKGSPGDYMNGYALLALLGIFFFLGMFFEQTRASGKRLRQKDWPPR